jgi:hypothetical protein
MTYFHPRDFDPDQPVISDLNSIRKIKSYYGLSSSLEKLSGLIKKFKFLALDEAEASINWNNTKKIHISDSYKIFLQ